jgi:hypothetical protein
MLMTVILVLALVGFACLGGWFIIRAFSGRRR